MLKNMRKKILIILKKNITKNNLNNIKVFDIALSDQEKFVFMSTKFKNGINQSAVYAIKDNGDIKIKSNKLDNLLEFKNKNIYIKCDTEGHDINVLKGMNKISSNNYCFLQVENNENNKTIGNYLKKLNFILTQKNDRDYFFTNMKNR